MKRGQIQILRLVPKKKCFWEPIQISTKECHKFQQKPYLLLKRALFLKFTKLLFLQKIILSAHTIKQCFLVSVFKYTKVLTSQVNEKLGMPLPKKLAERKKTIDEEKAKKKGEEEENKKEKTSFCLIQ